jgi:hypothetical protein
MIKNELLLHTATSLLLCVCVCVCVYITGPGAVPQLGYIPRGGGARALGLGEDEGGLEEEEQRDRERGRDRLAEQRAASAFFKEVIIYIYTHIYILHSNLPSTLELVCDVPSLLHAHTQVRLGKFK